MKYILIIGATSDIARATARIYARSGYDLYLAARRPENLEGFAADIAIRTGRTARCLKLDILDEASHAAFYHALEEKPVGVISAVGYLGDQEKAQSNFEEARKIIDTNYTGVVSLLNIVADDFEARKAGFIVGIGSVAGDRGRKSNFIYGSSKAGLSAYLSGLRNRLHSAGVQVLTVKPGFVKTRMTRGMKLPGMLTAEAEEAAEDIFRAQQGQRDIRYSKWMWRWIMLLIRSTPERIFKRMNL